MVSGVCHNYWYPHQRIEHKKKDTTFVVSFFLQRTVKIDIFSFQGKAPIVWYTDRAPSVNGSRLESSRNVFVLRKGYTNILKR